MSNNNLAKKINEILETNPLAEIVFITSLHDNYSTEQNVKRNKSLWLKLMLMGYQILTVTSDSADKHFDKERSRTNVFKNKGVQKTTPFKFKKSELVGYLVLNTQQRDILSDLISLAVFFEQENILLINNSDTAWIDSNPLGSSFKGKTCAAIPLNIEMSFDDVVIQFNQSKDGFNSCKGWGFNSRFLLSQNAKRHWSELEIEETVLGSNK